MHSEGLLWLAQRMHAGPFADVTKVIKDLIARLQEEQTGHGPADCRVVAIIALSLATPGKVTVLSGISAFSVARVRNARTCTITNTSAHTVNNTGAHSYWKSGSCTNMSLCVLFCCVPLHVQPELSAELHKDDSCQIDGLFEATPEVEGFKTKVFWENSRWTTTVTVVHCAQIVFK